MKHEHIEPVSDESIEAAIQRVNANVAPRVTTADVEANIVGEHYFTAAQGTLGAIAADNKAETLHIPEGSFDAPLRCLDLLTFCVLVLKNGFTVTGESACASPENFNAEIGRKIARQNAVAKIWPLMGYQLKERLHQAAIVAEACRNSIGGSAS